MLYMLFTGARDVQDPEKAEHLIRTSLGPVVAKLGPENIIVVHGCAEGIDSIVRDIVDHWHGLEQDTFPASYFASPLMRNKFMVKYVSDKRAQGHKGVCWAFAKQWMSGTGHCARYARAARIPTVDYGVPTERRS